MYETFFAKAFKKILIGRPIKAQVKVALLF
jgi:hypothetical protein